MIWTTWRQHRTEAGVGALILAALAAAMIVVGNTARNRARGLGLPQCTKAHRDCSDALNALHRDFHTIPPFTAALIAIPLLAGMFWAAPLVSREYEAGTHRLAWTQSVSPLRWITTKIVLIFGLVAVAAIAIGPLASWTFAPLTLAFGGRYNSTWYDTQGLVPVACVLFALAVGVAASALIRRTVPAMVITLVVYAAARIPIHFFRAHFAPTASHTSVIPLISLLQKPTAGLGEVSGLSPADLSISVTVTSPAGHRLSNNGGNLEELQHYCPKLPNRGAPSHSTIEQCAAAVKGLSLRQKVTYQPASHFWFIQTVESVIFVGLAALFVAAAILAVTRRRPS